MRKVNLNILVTVCLFLMTLTGPAVADTHYVNPGQSIQAAINAANKGDEIEVAPGTYYEAINFNGKAVRLYSSGGPSVTIINGNGAYHIVQCISGEDPNTILEGFTITGGIANGTSWPDYHGAGMLNNASSPTVTNCIFSVNSATDGGGMYNYNSNPTVTNCSFSGNPAQNGAGMYNFISSPTLTRCTFISNTTFEGKDGAAGSSHGGDGGLGGEGAGMYNNQSHATVTDCIFSLNMTGMGGTGGDADDLDGTPGKGGGWRFRGRSLQSRLLTGIYSLRFYGKPDRAWCQRGCLKFFKEFG